MNNENKTMNKKLNKKYLKIGSFSMVMTAVVLAAVILLNLFISEIPSTYTKATLPVRSTSKCSFSACGVAARTLKP